MNGAGIAGAAVIALVLAVAVWHVERGAVARAEIDRVAKAAEIRGKSIVSIQAATSKALKANEARLKLAQAEVLVLKQRMGALSVPDATGQACPAGCEVIWPGKEK